MQKLSIILLSILTLVVGCAATKPAVVVPSMERHCPAPVRPTIEYKDVWTIQDIMQMNLLIIDYSLKLEQTVKCWEQK